ncbi:pilin [Shewanella sp. NFH-SH190041]|uniref:prepilin-type N-terminal cleavage/methylation domain-containing protein n=1 Tax=Shewanella sp. NFH-SH190041 TaxID=2950245 RepID=UPI0021C3B9F9|nr:prepilin-type N-terminal cleavage/methylation domain-containing protein [Shewanella sp. NFH-SH190041]BDM65553.1 pilin [Shewanella sp. NFH-SH190041]
MPIKDRLSRARHQGFTLIELIVVIIILGLLAVVAAPKFLNFEDYAHSATVKATGGAFKTGVDLVQAAWVVRGAPPGGINDAPVFSDNPNKSGTVDINGKGWPTQHFITGPAAGTEPTLNNVPDCLSVWRILFSGDEPTVTDTTGAQYKATYTDPGKCRYTLIGNPNMYIDYDSNTGDVITTAPDGQ